MRDSGQPCRCRAKALDLRAGEVRVRLRDSEVTHHAHDVMCRRRELGEPPPPHARVELQVHAQPLRHPTVGRHELEVRGARLTHLSIAHRAHDDDPGLVQRRTQVECLGECRDTQSRGTGVERRPGDVGRSVAVPLGLDDGPELGFSGGA